MPAPNSANHNLTNHDSLNHKEAKRHSYDYAVVRVVPFVERGEFLNVGVILFCRTQRFLDARVHFDGDRLRALAPHLSADKVERIQRHVDFIPRICAGEGPIGALAQAERFHWLVAPHSTVVQMSPVHCGLCVEPARALEDLLERMVGR